MDEEDEIYFKNLMADEEDDLIFLNTLNNHPEMFMNMEFMIANKKWWTPELFDNHDNIIIYRVLDAIFRPYWETVLQSMLIHFQTSKLNMWIPPEFTRDNCSMQIHKHLTLVEFIRNFKIPIEVKNDKYIPYIREIEDLIDIYTDIYYG